MTVTSQRLNGKLKNNVNGLNSPFYSGTFCLTNMVTKWNKKSCLLFYKGLSDITWVILDETVIKPDENLHSPSPPPMPWSPEKCLQ